jgi:cbb3-type cytochrome oxidase subunit 1
MATGLIALSCGIAWLVAQPMILATYHYTPQAVAATHLFVLGWIATVIMGAMYQLAPVALETRLYSERLARWQFVFHVVGFAGMVWMFRVWNMPQVGHFACLLGVGFALFAYNIARTLWLAPKKTVAAWSMAAALFWICFTGVAGLSIAAGKCVYDDVDKFPVTSAVGALLHGLRAVGHFVARFAPMGAMHAHAHLGLVGFILMLMVGISYKLIPMFTLSEIQNARRAAWSIALLNIGLAGAFLSILLQNRWKPIFAVVIVSALILYGCELAAILRARKRRALDWGVRYFLAAILWLVAVSIIGLVLSWPGLRWTDFTGQLENVYGFIAVMGVVSFAIIGMLYKIAPFLVWFGVYSPHIGRARVPALADLYSPRLQAIGFWSFQAGIVAASAAILCQNEIGVRTGCGALAVSIGTLAANLGKMTCHYFRPRILPLQKSTL